jgi:hypothetical protein
MAALEMWFVLWCAPSEWPSGLHASPFGTEAKAQAHARTIKNAGLSAWVVKLEGTGKL